MDRSKLTLIKGNKKDFEATKFKLQELYKNAFVNAMIKAQDTLIEDRESLKKVVYYGVKYIDQKERRDISFTREQAEAEFSLLCLIKDIMKLLTLGEFINIFPIPKEYDGEKWLTKDYFYAIREFGKYDINNPISTNLEDILWDTMNNDIFAFNAYLFSVMSCLRRLQGEKGIMEEFFEDQGVEMLHMHESNDVKYLQSSKTGKSFPIKTVKKKPKYLKVV
jgi:hypothetical protein